MVSLDKFKTTYFEECAELLDALNSHLTSIEEQRTDGDTLHAIFRAVHSIKGGAGAFSFNRLVAFAHAFETLLDMVRDGRVAVTDELVALFHRAADKLSDMVEAARAGEELAAGDETHLMRELAEASGVNSPKQADDPGSVQPSHDDPPASEQTYRISFVPRAEMFQRANEPLLLVRELKRLGKLKIVADHGRLPDIAALEPEHAYLSWTIDVTTAAQRAAVDEIFEFVNDDCDLKIEVANTRGASAGRASSDGKAPADLGAEPPKSPQGANGSVQKNGSAKPDRAGAVQTIRVDVEKVDRVVNLVGELVINQAMLLQFGSDLPADVAPALVNGLETLSKHLRELQDSVMAMRAQPVKSVFMRMPRLVRELSAQMEKDVHLVTSGEETEIDKTVIEQLADPLTHLLRNALDHGIESPAERQAQGKPPKGTIHLSAQHRSGRIVIELGDDGRGIDRKRVLAKAQERGLIAGRSSLSDEEIDNLLFLPGFSTADHVSNVSGRGVGLDVVKRNVQALGGRVSVESRPGSGARFTLSLPLTLAVLDGMVVAVGKETYIVPLTNIAESLRPKSEDVHPVVGRGDVLAIRGEYVPLVYLHRTFGVPDAVTDPSRGIVIVVEVDGGKRIGLVVDDLLGQHQVVVKSIEANYDAIDGISGATILGSGRVALILDVSRLRDSQTRVPSIAGKKSDPAFLHSAPGVQ